MSFMLRRLIGGARGAGFVMGGASSLFEKSVRTTLNTLRIGRMGGGLVKYQGGALSRMQTGVGRFGSAFRGFTMGGGRGGARMGGFGAMRDFLNRGRPLALPGPVGTGRRGASRWPWMVVGAAGIGLTAGGISGIYHGVFGDRQRPNYPVMGQGPGY